MRVLEFLTGHVIYNPAYTYKFQLKATLEISATDKVKKTCQIAVLNNQMTILIF